MKYRLVLVGVLTTLILAGAWAASRRPRPRAPEPSHGVSHGASTYDPLGVVLFPATTVRGDAPSVNLISGNDSLSVTQGSAAGGSTRLAIKPINGFVGRVMLSVVNIPGGMTAVCRPSFVDITGPAVRPVVLRVVAGGATRPGYYTLTAVCSGGASVSAWDIEPVTVAPAPNKVPFKLAATDPGLDSFAGSRRSCVITLSMPARYYGRIALDLSDDPVMPILGQRPGNDTGKIYASFSRRALNTSGTSTLNFRIGASVPIGTYHFLVTGTSSVDGKVQITPFTLSVSVKPATARPDDMASSPVVYTGDRPLYALAKSLGDMDQRTFPVFAVPGTHTWGPVPGAGRKR